MENNLRALEAQPLVMDCAKFVELVQLIVDEEATSEEEQLFKDHYEKCKHCLNYYEIEKSAVAVIKNKISKNSPPPELANQIRAKILES
ncbi:hypothetical protein AAG747_16810 [Rapidithrix thailandica]|uniref:Anti-sigma factor n=1 Tax=Rapidithrix thailandica TaxID=413964 RepID=A0AAW9S0H9_9BACT